MEEMKETRCKHFKQCGGCQYALPYEQQLERKQTKVESLLGSFARVEPIMGMDNPYHYRNKVQSAFALTRDRKVISGVYQANSHRVVCVDRCLTEDWLADDIIVGIRRMLPDFNMIPYNEDSEQGFLRHVLVKRGFASGQVMVVLVTASPVFPLKKKFVAALRERFPQITTVLMNINNQHTSMLLGSREEVLYGTGYIEDTLCGCVFRISAKSFYQINPLQTEKLYGKALEFAGLTGKERVLDAYCGIGTIGLIAAKTAGEVIGVEVNRDAVRDAVANARRNQAENIRFFCDDAGNFMQGMAAEKIPVDVVFMDPPRAGSDEAFLSSVAALKPKKVVYISCNPETQKRDLIYLTHHGYRVIKIQPVDMFPHTTHIETVCLLVKKNNGK